MSVSDWAGGKVFKFVHGNNLVYNTCWEDPRLDHTAMNLTPDDTVLVITSAGCNALDYALAGPRKVVAVDMNPRQNALLELKLAGIRNLEYEDFFAMFGNGRLSGARKIYDEKLRPALGEWPQQYWDRWIEFFDPSNRRPFYFRGTSGTFAMLVNLYLNRVAKLRPKINELLECTTLDQQQEVYDGHLRDRIWSRPMRFAMRRDTVLSLLGIPRPQRYQIETQYSGGLSQFVRDCLDAVFARLPLADNYFWRLYMTGRYAPNCCPEYLKPHNFQKLRDGLADRVDVHTDSVEGFLTKDPRPITRFVLLDHMDWLSTRRLPLLAQEWQWIVRRAAPGTRILWRSAGLRTEFVDRTKIKVDGRTREVGELLTYDRPLAEQLHPQCRVHTYGSFHIADLAA
ncbi:MAG TPA: BtaA family protein [Pirellulales bacterium]|nr:BtaA family protein [Pirellulales bacterium]